MKKLGRILTLVLAFCLVIGAVPAAAAHPEGYWPYLEAYTNAVKEGNTEKILSAGDAMLDFYSDYPINKDIAGICYNIYYYRYENQLFEKSGSYDKAVDNMNRLADVSDILGFTDMSIIARAGAYKLRPNTEVYALSDDVSLAPYFGAKYEPRAGAYFGRTDNPYSGESAVSFYVEISRETAADFAYLISPNDDGEHIIQICYNFDKEGGSLNEILSGAYDSGISKTLSYIATLQSPVFLRIGAEMNLWEVDAKLYRNTYLYIAKQARTVCPNAALVFSVNYASYWGGKMTDYYPGDSYVDWVGVSLYANPTAAADRGTAICFGTADFADYILSVGETVRAFGGKKPIMVTESGCGHTSTGGTDNSKMAAEQTAKLYSALNMVYPQIKAIFYFDRLSKAWNYRMSDCTSVTGAYNSAVASNPTLLKSAGASPTCTYVPLDRIKSPSGVLRLAAYSDTVLSGSMTVRYYVDGRLIASPSALPYSCTLDTGTLSGGKHTLKVIFDDGKGYRAEKSYSISCDAPAEWAKEEIELAKTAGLLDSGFLSDYNGNITRGDFCRLVVRMMECKSGKTASELLKDAGVTMQNAFTDTTADYINVAAALGIVSGRGNGIFDSYAGITRQEAAKMLAVAAEWLGVPSASPVSFTDESSFAPWAVKYIAAISGVKDAVSGKAVMGGIGDGKFGPMQSYSRQQAYLTMLRLYRAQL